MRRLLLSAATDKTLERIGLWLIIAGLIGEAILIIVAIPPEKIPGEAARVLSIICTLAIAFGVWVEHVGSAAVAAPRRLTVRQRAILSDRLKTFSGTNFAMSVAGAEAIDFAADIADALKASGWQWINWPLGGIAVRLPHGRPEVGQDLMRGIEIHIFDASRAALAGELFQSFGMVGYQSPWVLMPPPSPQLADKVIIIVGSKP